MRLEGSTKAHVAWLRSIGVEEGSGTSPFAGLEVDRLPAPRSWPPDLVEWYDARLWDRFGDLQAVGLRSVGDLYPPMSSDFLISEFEELRQSGLYPKSPALLWRDEKGLSVIAETEGPNAGVLYWMDVVDALDGFAGRLCGSLTEYLASVRALVDADVLSPHEYPAWAEAAWSAERVDEPCPPLDTPGPIVGVPWPTVGEGIPVLTNPVAPSLAKLVDRHR